jgi:hypothetical protein
MSAQNINKVLKDFWKKTIREAKSNLNSGGINSSKRLYKSLAFSTVVEKEFVSSTFVMEDYGLYRDKGVSGTVKKYNTPYSYTTKKPPASAFSGWSVRTGLAPRTSTGAFASRKSLQFALANHIFKMGIKPSLFFTEPFERLFKLLPDLIEKAAGDDIEAIIDKQIILR